jgi:DNA-binding response OmpR family regulator
VKTVLIVDDDPALLEEQARDFRPVRHEFRLLTAGNGREATVILDSDRVDVLITDLEMPVMDGFELLAYVLQSHPTLAIIVMGEVDSDSLGLALEAAGSTDYVRKPLAPGLLVNKVKAAFARRARGHISGISLASFLQLLHIDKRSCVLTLRSAGQRGSLEILDGEVVSAVCDGLKGEKAAYEILTWSHPDIEMRGSPASGVREITAPLQHLLIEAARQQDESARGQPLLATSWLDAPPELPAVPESTLAVEQRETLSRAFQELLLFDGALGVALVDLRSSRCLLSESRGLAAEFERLAAALAGVMRVRLQLLEGAQSDEDVESVVVRLTRHVEVLVAYGQLPHLVLYFLGDRAKVKEAEITGALAVIVGPAEGREVARSGEGGGGGE